MRWTKRVFGRRRLAWTLASPIFVAGLAGSAGSVAAAQAPPAPAAPAPPPPRFVVVMDAAHGGDDSGGRLSDGQPEKAFTLALSVRLRSLLAARGIPVITTRESDETLDLDRRAAIANRAYARPA